MDFINKINLTQEYSTFISNWWIINNIVKRNNSQLHVQRLVAIFYKKEHRSGPILQKKTLYLQICTVKIIFRYSLSVLIVNVHKIYYTT